jgi:hypothetical protein
LWRGDIDGAVRLFDDWPHERVDQFIGYLTKRIFGNTEKVKKVQTNLRSIKRIMAT